MVDINLGGAQDVYFDIISGNDANYEKISKFGRNSAVSTTPVPICVGGVYQTPTSVTTLEAISTSTSDTSDGLGARTITVVGLNASCVEIEEDITMNGTSATTATSNSFLRVYRAYVKTSGVYATSSAGSHVGDITIRAVSAGATYAKIDVTTFPRGQSQIGSYSVPATKTAYIKNITVNTSAATNIMIFQRDNLDDTSSPYSGVMKLLQEYDSVNGIEYLFNNSPLGPFSAKTDFGFMAYTDSGTTKVSVDFDIIQSI